MNKKKILIVASAPKSLINFRGDLIKDLITNNFEVYTAAPHLTQQIKDELINIGAHPVNFDLQRTNLNPIADYRSIKFLKKIIKENKIDLVFPYTIKPVIYGSFAANSLHVPTISLITGLGYTFSGQSLKSRTLQKVTQFLYKQGLKNNVFTFFQNKDDYNLFVKKGIIRKNHPYDVVSGSGVNLTKFEYRENLKNNNIITFVFVARLIEEKGIYLFIEAAKQLKQKYSNAYFKVLGGVEHNSPSGIDKKILEIERKRGTIIFNGYSEDMVKDLSESDVFVLPTYYREGIPRSILEALSIGMPIITTNTPGCKETIIGEENKNGILIEPKSLEDLTKAMEFFIKSPKMVFQMGIRSRRYAEERFDVKIINKVLIDRIKYVLK
jgi:glycosyltransferase involved in cell wall biosynthesis